MIRQLKYLIIGISVVVSSCATNKDLETQLIEAGMMTNSVCLGGKGVWEEISDNKYVFRCDSDILSQWSKTTSPTHTKKPSTQGSLEGSSSKKYSCQDPVSGLMVKNGASIRYSDGTRTCVNGKWSDPKNSSGGSNSGGSGGGNSGRTLISTTCTLSTTGLTSDWNGAQYSWTIWNIWSDGSRSVASMGSGYGNQVPYGC